MVKQNKSLLNESSVILVSGGAKGITAQCAIRIAEAAACRFILVGRSTVLAEEPQWAAGVSDSQELQARALDYYKAKGEKVTPKALQKAIGAILSSREIKGTIQQIEARGGQALYVSADVTDGKSLASQVKAAVEKLGPVSGVIHGAGNLADKLIENKDGRDFDLVVNTKIQGLQNILQAVDPGYLKFLVLFSSVAGFFGNLGQADYAIANEILNKSAHILRKSLPDCRVIAIDWGPWDSGMVSPQLKKLFEKRNIRLISTESGTQALVDEITRPQQHTSQLIVGSPLDTSIEIRPVYAGEIRVKRKLKLKDNPFLNDHRIGPQAVLPATCASAWLVDTCQSLYPGFFFFHMDDFKILKGITFDDHEQEYEMTLKPLPENDGVKKTYEVTITSLNEKKRRIFHYSGQVTLVRELPAPPKHRSVRELGLDAAGHRPGVDFYQDGTLFHGPSFQGVQEVLQINDSGVIMRVSLPNMSQMAQGQFPALSTNPYVNDAIVQSLLIWTQEFYDAPCLPSRLHQWDQYRNIPFDTPVWVILNVTYHNQHAVVGDLLVLDEDGSEFYEFRGLEGTVSSYLKRFIGKKESRAA